MLQTIPIKKKKKKKGKKANQNKLLSFSSPYLCPPESITLNHGSIFVYTAMTRHSEPDLVSNTSAFKSLSQDHHLRNKRCCLNSDVGCSNQIDVGDLKNRLLSRFLFFIFLLWVNLGRNSVKRKKNTKELKMK